MVASTLSRSKQARRLPDRAEAGRAEAGRAAGRAEAGKAEAGKAREQVMAAGAEGVPAAEGSHEQVTGLCNCLNSPDQVRSNIAALDRSTDAGIVHRVASEGFGGGGAGEANR